MPTENRHLTLDDLVNVIAEAHRHFAAQAGKAVNIALTLRNWLIGCQIELYERNGVDRANYGDRVMDMLAESLQKRGLARCERRELYRYRQLFLTYPSIVESLIPQTPSVSGRQILESLSKPGSRRPSSGSEAAASKSTKQETT